MSDPQASGQAERFEVRVTADSHFAWLRTRLAVERTMMAYMRTAVALIGFGFTIFQFLQRVQEVPGRAVHFPRAAWYLEPVTDSLRRGGGGHLAVRVSAADQLPEERRVFSHRRRGQHADEDAALRDYGRPDRHRHLCLFLRAAERRVTDSRHSHRCDPAAAGERPAGLPPAGQAERVDLQHRLHVLLLPVQGIAVPERQAPHVRGHARGLHPPVARVAPHATGHGGLAGWRADADEARVLSPRGRTGREAPPARPDRAAHLPDQRPADRRRLVRVLQAAQLPRRPERRRPARAARHLPGRPPRPGHLRPGDARLAVPAQARGRLQHPVHGQRRQPAPRPRGLSLLPRRARREVGAVHPDHRARHRADDRRSPTRAGASRPARSACSTRRPATWSPSARSAPSSTAASWSTSSRSGCATTWARCTCSSST